MTVGVESLAAGAEAPEIFPLSSTATWSFGTAGNFAFGWTRVRARRVAQFQVQKNSPFTGLSTVKAWPLTQDGWQDAWDFMRAEHPALAENVAVACRNDSGRRADVLRSAEYRSILEAQEQLGALTGCVFLGGYGLKDGIHPGASVDLHFTRDEIWISKAAGYTPYLRRNYETAHALEFEGGVIRKGGGYFGGGIGVVGAAEGIAMATLLNSLTTKTTIHTTVRLEAKDAELFFFTGQAAPQTLLMKFAEVRGRIKAAAPQALPAADTSPDPTDRLLQLGAMFEKGLLNADEFAAAKARLLN